MPAAPQLHGSSPLRPFKRHALWLLIAFFVAIATLTGRNLGRQYDAREDAQLALAWAEMSLNLNRVIHELQKERGLSSGLLASRGREFGPALRVQYLQTDAAIRRLREASAATAAGRQLLEETLARALPAFDILPALRTEIEGLRLSRDVAVARYTERIDLLFDRQITTMSASDSGALYRQQMALIFFLQAKEMAGQERALIAAMLSANDFSPARMAAFHRIQAQERGREEKFLQLATPEVADAYRALREQPFVTEADRIRRLVLAIGASQRTDLRPQAYSAEDWFQLSTRWIDALAGFEQVQRERLLDSARVLRDDAQWELLLNAAVAFASGLLAGFLVLQLWRGKEVAEQNLQLAAMVFNHSLESIIVTDAEVRIVEVNDAFTRITGYTREEAIGQHPRLLKSGRHDQRFYAALWERLQRTGHWEGEIWNRRKNGDIYPGLLSIVAVRDRRGRVIHYIAMAVDLAKYKETEALLEQLRTFDPLTGLPNREAWHSAVDQAVANVQRNGGQFALLDIGLDRFKIINESLGHTAGDKVLVAAAERIKLALRRHDIAARAGGDRFSLLLPDLGDPRDVGSFCERLLAAFAVPMEVDGQPLYVSISIGVTICPDDGAHTGSLLQNGEVALYRAKEESRGGYKFFSAEMNAASSQLLALEQMLRQALERGEFAVVYQPQVDRAGHLIGVEALLRWRSLELGMISPVQFIPIAEATGLILPIGEWALGVACRDARQWRESFGFDLPVAVNLSARQFRDDRLAESIAHALADNGLPGPLLELEITEGLLMADPGGAAAILGNLRRMGIRIALDDFGTGYSSLAYLKTFPLDRLKIDRAFVDDLPDSPEDCAIARTVIGLGHNLGLEVLAEGVETSAQRNFLAEAGCDAFQGYLHGRPMPAAQLAEAVRDGTLRPPAPA